MRRTTKLQQRFVPILLASVFAFSGCSGKKNSHRPDPVEPVEQGPTAQELFTKGNASLDKGKWEAAVATYDEAVEKDAGQWEAHMNRGIALSRVAKFGEALDAFEDSLRNGGDQQALVYFNLGNLYQDRGMYSAAVDAYRASLAYEGANEIDTLVNLGAAYLFLRQWQDATATYQYTQQLAPDDPRPLHGIALVKQMQDQYRDAAQIYDQVHSIDPNFALAYFNQARCFSMMKDYQAASGAISNFIRLAPESKVLGRAKGMLKRYKEKLAGNK